MKKILFVHQYYFPEMTGTGRRTRELAESLVKKGFDCTVLTTKPRKFRSMINYSAPPFEELNGVKVYRINTLFFVQKNVLTRLISYFLHFLLSFIWISKRRNQFSLIISVAPLSSGIVGAFAQRFFGIPHHFDVPDILPDLGIAAGMIQNKILIKLLYKIEKWVYDNASSISPITFGQIDNIRNKCVPEYKLYHIPDWVDIDFFKINGAKYNSLIREKINPNSEYKIISFVGNIGALQGVESFVEVVKMLNIEFQIKYKFLFIGDGICLEMLKEKVRNEKVNNIKFIGRVPREYIPSYMNLSDVLVANYISNEYMNICIPGKIFEYIISNKPIVIGAFGEAANLINTFHAGETVEPSNAKMIKNSIIKILLNPEKYKYDIKEFENKYSLATIVNDYIKLIISKY